MVGKLGEFPDEDGDLGVGMVAGVAPFNDVIITGTGIGFGFGGDVLIEVGRRRGVSQDDDLTAGEVYGVKAIRCRAFDVSGGVLEFGGFAKVRDPAVVHIDESAVGDEDGLGFGGFVGGGHGGER